MKSKTLIYDIEIVITMDRALLARLYTGFLRPGMLMNANLAHMLMFGYKWEGDKKAKLISMADYPKEFKNNPNDDSRICKDVLEVMNEAEHLVAHYGDKFDRKFVDTRLLLNKLPRLPSKLVLTQSDTCQIAKSHLKFDSNRLDVLAKALELTPKGKKEWPDWWLKAAFGDLSGVIPMGKYCKQDVDTLAEVYEKLKPYDPKMVSPELSSGKLCVCSNPKLTKRGFHTTRTGKYQRYQCQTCGRFSLARTAMESATLRG